jgi:hypothetical protein
MIMLLIILLPLLVFAKAKEAKDIDFTEYIEKKVIPKPFSRDWGNYYTWYDCSTGRQELTKKSIELNKPILWILWWENAQGCYACHHLQSDFAMDNEVQRLSKNFLLVNCRGNEIPEDKDFLLDGEYAPKIIFTDVVGNVRPEIYNKHGKHKYKYYYVDAGMLQPSMHEAAKLLRGELAEL